MKNNKKVENFFFEKYFSTDENSKKSKFQKFREKMKIRHLRKKMIFEKNIKNFRLKIFHRSKTFFNFFCFRKLHVHSYPISYRTPYNSSWSLRTSILNFQKLEKNKIIGFFLEYSFAKRSMFYKQPLICSERSWVKIIVSNNSSMINVAAYVGVRVRIVAYPTYNE